MKLGKAFSDNVILEQRKHTKLKEHKGRWWFGVGRALLFMTVLIVSMGLLTFRLFQLTIIQGHTYRVLADSNRTRELIRHAPRGVIRDRTGAPLVENVPQYRLMQPCEAGSADSCLSRISQEEGEKLLAEGLPAGQFLEIDYERRYLADEVMSHVVGYTGEITEEELNDEYYTIRKYRRGDRLGREGAESIFEERLRGRDGRELVEVDASGRILRTLGRDPEIPGSDIFLSVDTELSKVAFQAFPTGAKGAVVVSKPKTGEILSLLSFPSFSGNGFSLGLSQDAYSALINNPARPMFNRAIGGVYPPGSTFKIVTSIAALEEGVVKPNETVEDTGVLRIGEFSFPNWYFLKYGKTDGLVNIKKALARSNDIYFYTIGERLGITRLAQWGSAMGVGKALGLELTGEAQGLMPDPAWKKQHFNLPSDREARHDVWYVGDTYHVSIGQGYLLTTPLQVNMWTNTFAGGGLLCRPTIQKSGIFGSIKPECRDVRLKQETIDTIMEGMRQACDTDGTGWPLFSFGMKHEPDGSVHPLGSSPSSSIVDKNVSLIPIACKTGTAEFGDPDDDTHAWFTAFAPMPAEYIPSSLSQGAATVISGEPEIVVSVLVEEAGEGSDKAAPIAKKIFEAWFGR